jgi:hypothetical protein
MFPPRACLCFSDVTNGLVVLQTCFPVAIWGEFSGSACPRRSTIWNSNSVQSSKEAGSRELLALDDGFYERLWFEGRKIVRAFAKAY